MTKHYCDICGQEIDTDVYYLIKYEKGIRGRPIGFAVKVDPFDPKNRILFHVNNAGIILYLMKKDK